MKKVEVSAICGLVAITPCAGYICVFNGKRWSKCATPNVMAMWNACSANRKVHRGIFKIRVVED